MAIVRQVCPFHADEDVLGAPAGQSGGTLEFTCHLKTGHPRPRPHSWLLLPEPPGLTGVSGYATELGLPIELPAAIGKYRGTWVEYGVVEYQYAEGHPEDFAAIVARYGHTARAPKSYTASAFLAGVLGILSRQGALLYHFGPATGHWRYNGTISWWSLPPEPDWDNCRLSWEDLGRGMSYVPGSIYP